VRRLAIATLPLLLAMCEVGQIDEVGGDEEVSANDALAVVTNNDGDPQASLLLGLYYGDTATADRPHIKQLQDDLMRLGYIAADLACASGIARSPGSTPSRPTTGSPRPRR